MTSDRFAGYTADVLAVAWQALLELIARARAGRSVLYRRTPVRDALAAAEICP